MTTAIERLEELLNEKDDELEQLRDKLEYTEAALRGVRDGWTVHQDIDGPQTLPVPRLELVYEQSDRGWGEYTIKYRLVFRHFCGPFIGIPISHTKISGGPGAEPPPISNGKIRLPRRDGMHIRHDARHFNLPAFAVLGDRVERIEPLHGPAPYETGDAT